MLLDVIFNGVQKLPGCPDQWVFTDRLSGTTFYTDAGITYGRLVKETARVRERFSMAGPLSVVRSEHVYALADAAH